jgi:hypothetical protein
LPRVAIDAVILVLGFPGIAATTPQPLRSAINCVLEYDGFEFHFAQGVPTGLINESTWHSYLTAADVVREKQKKENVT